MVRKLIGALTTLSLVTLVAGCGGQATSTTSGATTPSTGTSATTTDAPATTAGTTSTQTPSSTTSTSTSTTPTTSTTTHTTSTQSTSQSQTSTSTTSNCGSDCQPSGTPAVAGSKPPVNGKCSAGYTYLPPQDGGPALCIPQGGPPASTTSSSTH